MPASPVAGGDAALLALLPGLAAAFVLTLARAGAVILLLPGFGEAEIPAPARAGLALGVALALLPATAPLLAHPPEEPAEFAALAAGEVATGLWLGWLARLATLALPIAGQLIATMVGLANVLQPDPALGAQNTALSRLLALAAPAIVLASGLYAWPLEALAGSYRLIPPGAVLPGGDAAQGVVAATEAAFALALQLAAPFVAAAVVWQAAMGLLARLVPRLQVYFTAMPGQLLGGLLLLSALSATVLGVWAEALRAGWDHLPGLG